MDIYQADSDAEISKLIFPYKLQESILFYSYGTLFTQSDAIIQILKTLGGGFKLVQIFYLIPRFLRDSIYRFIARNRYKIFGKRKKCHFPGAEFTDRYL